MREAKPHASSIKTRQFWKLGKLEILCFTRYGTREAQMLLHLKMVGIAACFTAVWAMFYVVGCMILVVAFDWNPRCAVVEAATVAFVGFIFSSRPWWQGYSIDLKIRAFYRAI